MNAREFRKEYDRLYMPLGMYALRLCEDTDVARDIVQTAFMEVWTRLEDGQEISSLKAYMYRAVHNAALSHLRRTGREEELPAEDMCPITDEDIDTSERDARLWQAIDSLPERRREIFLLSKRDGLTYAQIAGELALSVKTVENQISKALATLRADNSLRSVPVFFLLFL